MKAQIDPKEEQQKEEGVGHESSNNEKSEVS